MTKTKHPGLPVIRVGYDEKAVVISNPAITSWAMRQAARALMLRTEPASGLRHPVSVAIAGEGQ